MLDLILSIFGDFHKVRTIISCFEKKSHGWTKSHGRTCPVGWMKVIRATLQCHLTLTCDYFDALGLSVLVMGKICS